MAAEVSSLVRVLNGYKDDGTVGGRNSTAMITRDLLGTGGCDAGTHHQNESQELDLDLQVPAGWEKRLDLKSGKVYLQRCNFSCSEQKHHQSNGRVTTNLQDLNFPPSASDSLSTKPLLNFFDETSLDLKLVSSSPSSSTSTNYQSVCTLDKVKYALERAEKEPNKKRPSYLKSSTSMSMSMSPSYSSSSSMKENTNEEENEESSSPVAAGCPGCLSYVLIMKNNPKCPRCSSFVPVLSMKKPKIDLNISI